MHIKNTSHPPTSEYCAETAILQNRHASSTQGKKSFFFFFAVFFNPSSWLEGVKKNKNKKLAGAAAASPQYKPSTDPFCGIPPAAWRCPPCWIRSWSRCGPACGCGAPALSRRSGCLRLRTSAFFQHTNHTHTHTHQHQHHTSASHDQTFGWEYRGIDRCCGRRYPAASEGRGRESNKIDSFFFFFFFFFFFCVSCKPNQSSPAPSPFEYRQQITA
jgi:hypothetical protein